MKKTFSKLFSLLMAVMMVMGLSTASLAADTVTEVKFAGGDKSGEEFQIINDGVKVGETDLFANFKNIVPGDVLTQEIKLSNASDYDYIIVSMKAVLHDEENNPVIKEVSDSDKWKSYEAMNNFLSQLTMEVVSPEGEVIFSSKPNELGGLAEFVKLGRINKEESKNITAKLTVPIEMGNEFASMIGEIDWIFHIDAFDVKDLIVTKEWSDGNKNHEEDEVTVHLYRNEKADAAASQSGEAVEAEPFETVKLNAENNWTYTFTELDEDYDWSVKEEPVKGYNTQYLYNEPGTGTNVIIKNVKARPRPHPRPDKDDDITVIKRWEDNNLKHRPTYVKVGLYDGSRLVKTVELNKQNNWTYEFKELDGSRNWIVREVNVPKDYVASYSNKSDTIVITNTEKLVQTGQLKWPIPVMAGIGIALMSFGAYMVFRKKNQLD